MLRGVDPTLIGFGGLPVMGSFICRHGGARCIGVLAFRFAERGYQHCRSYAEHRQNQEHNAPRRFTVEKRSVQPSRINETENEGSE
jgi:hypothetical protein